MAPDSDEQDFKQLQRHDIYYLHGGDLHLLAGNISFRVHSYFFERESRAFHDLIVKPASPGRPQQGTHDSNAIVLDVAPDEFEKLLWVFYNPKYSLYEASVDDWTSILELAHRWQFDEVKNLAIRELEKKDLPVVQRIALYQTYMVDKAFLIPLYADLCSRGEPPDDEESQLLGMKTTLIVYRARERLRAQPSDGGRSPLPPGLEIDDVHNTIMGLLGIVTPISSPTEGQSGQNASGGWEKPLRRLGANRLRMGLRVRAENQETPGLSTRIRMGEPDEQLVIVEREVGADNSAEKGGHSQDPEKIVERKIAAAVDGKVIGEREVEKESLDRRSEAKEELDGLLEVPFVPGSWL